MSAEEAWAPGIQKYLLSHRHEGPLGCIYLDLHPRCSVYTYIHTYLC